MQIGKFIVGVLHLDTPAFVFMHLIHKQILAALRMELFNEIQQLVCAEIDVVETDIQYFRGIRRAKHLQNALRHECRLANALLSLNHQQTLVPVDFVHEASDKIETHGLHSIDVSSNQ